MFWKKKLDRNLASRNPLYALAFAALHDSVSRETSSASFESYISDARIIKIISAAYESTKGAVDDIGSSQVFANLTIQLEDLLKSKVNEYIAVGGNEAEQLGWTLNVLRDIIFAYAPAISLGSGKDTHSITNAMIESIIKGLENDFVDWESKFTLPLLKMIQDGANVRI